VSFQFDYGIVGERGAVGIFRISVQPARAWCGQGWTDHLGCGATIEWRSKPTSPPSRSAAFLYLVAIMDSASRAALVCWLSCMNFAIFPRT
jgi:hypothetical protein